MHLPAPLASAGVATLVQFNCSLFVVVAWFTRINSALLVCALSGVILQNLLIGRDPQLTILYTLGCRDARIHRSVENIHFDARASSKAEKQ